MKANKNKREKKPTDRMNVMIIIIVSPLIVAIKIDQHSFHIEIHSIVKMWIRKCDGEKKTKNHLF